MVRSKGRAGVESLSPDEIRRIREKLRLTQAEAGEFLGGGPRAFTKYEAGVIAPAASVVNLLRLLDQSPDLLDGLRTKRVVPLSPVASSPFEVAADHVAVLSAAKFALLVQRLLAAEALNSGLPLDGIHVAAEITAGDGGEDARIEWQNGPERTMFIRNRRTQFQLKATKITPATAAKSVLTRQRAVLPMVRQFLESGGSYVLLISKPTVKQTLDKHVAAIRAALAERGVRFDPDQVVVRDGAQIAMWVNRYPAVAAWLLEQTRPGLTEPFRDWSHWAGRPEHERSPWVDDARLPDFRAKLRLLVATPRGVARVLGRSGVGKSRLVLKALGPNEGEEASHINLSALVVYATAAETAPGAIESAVQKLADSGLRAIVVVDRCEPEMHDNLAGMVKRVESQLSLITIDHEFTVDSEPSASVLRVEEAAPEVVAGIVRQGFPNIEGGEQQRIARLAAGFPQAARLIAEAWEGASLVGVSRDDIVERVLLGRRITDKTLVLKAGMLLSVFGFVGIEPPSDSDLSELAALPGTPPETHLRAAFEDLRRRGVAQRRGRLLTLQPAPIWQPLALRQWREWDLRTWDALLAEKTDRDLRRQLARQLTLLNRETFPSEIVRSVCRLNGPFASLERIQTDGAAEIVKYLAQIDAHAVVNLLEHVLAQLDASQLGTIEGETRRNIVRALEYIGFCEDTFEQAAHLLLSLAVAESEQYSNNATGMFKALFPVFGANTQSGPDLRLRVVDDALKSNDLARATLVVEALLSGADLRGGVRLLGAEVHGARPAMSPWRPRVWGEVWDYVRACLNRLAMLATRPDAAGERAKAGLGNDFRSLVSRGLLDDVEKLVFKVTPQRGPYWPQAHESLSHVLEYDSKEMNPDVVARVQYLINWLSPIDLDSRVRFFVTEMPWDYPAGQGISIEDRSKHQTEVVDALAGELLDAPDELSRLIPRLSRASQRMGVELGRSLARRSSDPERWLGKMVDAYSASPAVERNFALLVGFLWGLAPTLPERVAAYKRTASQSADLAPTLPAVCSAVGLEASDIALALEAWRANRLPTERLRDWTFGGALAKLSYETVTPLFDALLENGGDSFLVGIDLMGMYVFGNRERLDDLRPQLRLAAASAGRAPKSQRSDLHDYHFKELVEWILAKGRNDADAAWIARSLAEQAAAAVDDESLNDQLIRPLMPQLLRGFPEVVWPILGQVIAKGRKEAWKLEHLLGDDFSFRVKQPAILELPQEVLFAWCRTNPDVAPAFVAGMLPVLTSRDPADDSRGLDPRLRRLLDEFGDRDDVLKAINRNIFTFGWEGSRADYFALYSVPLHALDDHPIPAVRKWAKQLQATLGKEEAAARNEDDEQNAKWGL